MTTHAPPVHFSSLKGDLGFSYKMAMEELSLEIADQFNALGEALGVATLWGRFDGSGTDVLRITRAGGLGIAARMTAVASETATVAPTSFTTGYDTVTCGTYKFARSQTYKAGLLGGPEMSGVLIDELKDLFPGVWLGTWRYNFCVLGSQITDEVSATGAAWTVAKELALAAYMRETLGKGAGAIVTIRHPEQVTDLIASARSEAAIQYGGPMTFARLQQVPESDNDIGDPLGLRMRIFQTEDVQQSGGDHQGFAFAEGTMGWARAETGALAGKTANPNGAALIPEYGVVIEEDPAGTKQTVRRWDATSWYGMALADDTLGPKVRIVSIDD